MNFGLILTLLKIPRFRPEVYELIKNGLLREFQIERLKMKATWLSGTKKKGSSILFIFERRAGGYIQTQKKNCFYGIFMEKKEIKLWIQRLSFFF